LSNLFTPDQFFSDFPLILSGFRFAELDEMDKQNLGFDRINFLKAFLKSSNFEECKHLEFGAFPPTPQQFKELQLFFFEFEEAKLFQKQPPLFLDARRRRREHFGTNRNSRPSNNT